MKKKKLLITLAVILFCLTATQANAQWALGLKGVDIHCQRYRLDTTAFLLVLIDGRIQRHSVNPSACIAAALVGVETVPKPNQDFLKQVVDFGLVVREHVAHRVDGPLVLPHQKFKLMFFVAVHNAFSLQRSSC